MPLTKFVSYVQSSSSRDFRISHKIKRGEQLNSYAFAFVVVYGPAA